MLLLCLFSGSRPPLSSPDSQFLTKENLTFAVPSTCLTLPALKALKHPSGNSSKGTSSEKIPRSEQSWCLLRQASRLSEHTSWQLLSGCSVIVCFSNTISQLLCSLQTLTVQCDSATAATVRCHPGASSFWASPSKVEPSCPSSYL